MQTSRPTPVRAVNGIIPVPPIFYFGLAILCSVIFVLTIPSVFHGVTTQESVFKGILDETAQTNPGIVLLGENVDIDVDEPSVTIRWSIVACGQEYMLPDSSGVHGSSMCGLPNFPLQVYVDGDDDPAGTFNPELIPYTDKGKRRRIQNLVQFDSDLVLDVHNDRLYPFDTYFLSSTLRATSEQNYTVPFTKLATVDLTSSFVVETVDVQSYVISADGVNEPSRDIDMYIRRPIEARLITLSLFASSWFLTHICIGNVILARRTIDVKPLLKLLIVNGLTLIGIPQIRNSMPDAPGLDGVLIDAIGFFPQMIIVGFSVVILLLTVIARELNHREKSALPRHASITPLPKLSGASRQSGVKHRPPPLPLPTSTSTEIAKYNMHRITQHLKGEFVFPPVNIGGLRSIPEEAGSPRSPAHKRFKTATGSPQWF
ncbi:hypothetical protein F5050DRAFT_1573035 [Lentinula boryana]|uniref:Transmembrane protein n=1 Tax=Lentinula boryana TaxID=40481 RepID=A0ABQ8QB28_9AGAR|nr:hypothetical protein F5050DRAFT_1573035 [Lentinula boryana]